MSRPGSIASMERLAKAFEAIKGHLSQTHGVISEETAALVTIPGTNTKKKDLSLNKKDRIAHCTTIADGISLQTFRGISDFPKFLSIAFELFLALCNDDESDVRMKADESLNKVIKVLIENHVGRIQIELYKEIKKNGPSRSIRAAMWRFAEMAHHIRPQKCRPYVVNLLPCIGRISRRDEESVQETLASFMHKVLPVLGCFLTDTEVKDLMKVFYPNLHKPSAATRRTAAACLMLICQHGRKPSLHFSILIQVLLKFVIPVKEQGVHMLLGVLLTLRHIIPHLSSKDDRDHSMKGSFGKMRQEEEKHVSINQLIQIYEFLLHCTTHSDHNVITATLETLQQLLRTPPPELLTVLFCKGGIPKKTIFEDKGRTTPDEQEEQEPVGGSNVPQEASLDDTIEPPTHSTPSTLMGDISSPVSVGLDLTLIPGTPTSGSIPNSPAPDSESATFSYESQVLFNDAEDEYSNMVIGDVDEDVAQSEDGADDLADRFRSVTVEEQEDNDELERRGSLEGLLHTTEDDDFEDVGEQGGQETSERTSGDIGDYTDDDEIPLLHCVRLLSSSFLLLGYKGGLVSDRQSRISVKSLSLGCVAAILKLHPTLFFIKLYKEVEGKEGDQLLRDVAMFVKHSDPQLKSQTTMLLGNVINSALLRSGGNFDLWSCEQCSLYKTEPIFLENLLNAMSSVLTDESSVAVRGTCQTIKSVLPTMCNSSHGVLTLNLTLDLLPVGNNSYWLVLVELFDLIGCLDFRKLHFIEMTYGASINTSCKFKPLNLQSKFLDVLFHYLGSEDHRVRTSSANALVTLIPKLYFARDFTDPDSISIIARDLNSEYLDPVFNEATVYVRAPTIAMQDISLYCHDPSTHASGIDSNLSRVVDSIMGLMNNSTSRNLSYGCIEALKKLSIKYPVIYYAGAWNCGSISRIPKADSLKQQKERGRSWSDSLGRSLDFEKLSISAGCGPLPIILSNLTSSLQMLDLKSHQDILLLAGNILSGAAFHCLKATTSKPKPASAKDQTSWPSLQNRLLVPLADQLLQHIVRVLNICSNIIEGTQPGPPKSQTALPTLPSGPSLSPIRRKAKGKDKDALDQGTPTSSPAKLQGKELKGDKPDGAEDKKNLKVLFGACYQLPHYMKLFDILKGAYGTYRVSLELRKREKFCSLLKTCLDTFSQLLEMASLHEVGKYTEELLGYLKSATSLEPTATILCVEQLLKALFSTNLISQPDPVLQQIAKRPSKATRLTCNIKPGLYQDCFTVPYTQYSQFLSSVSQKADQTSDIDSDNAGWFGWVKAKVGDKKQQKAGSKEKTSLHGYIRLFEPLVIKALKQYTMTSCLGLQQQVLHLLAQLVQLRVNYCLLDADQIFINFVIKQFEHLEEGQIKDYETLIPHIFYFLVLLSYERYHSKNIITMPKIIQLCDGIMASGQKATTHAVPALQPLVHDLFVLRSSSKSESAKDLETQREVVVYMLTRLIQFHQVLDMLLAVLQQAHKENEEKWKRLSRQSIDIILPLLAKQQMNLDSQKALDSLHQLLAAVAPSALRPVDILLKTLMVQPPNFASLTNMQRWLAMVLAIINILISQSKEEVVLSRLSDLRLNINLVASPQVIEEAADYQSEVKGQSQPIMATDVNFARFLLQVIGITAERVQKEASASATDYQFLSQQLSHFLLYITHMFKSGSFRKVCSACITCIHSATSEGEYSLSNLNTIFLSLVMFHPTIVLQWCKVLLLLDYSEPEWWTEILKTKRRQPLSKSLSSGSMDNLEMDLDHQKAHCHSEIVRRGGLVLYCDYVCENQEDVEPMTWLIVNHVNDILELSHEPPVHDFISAIHRNAAGSGLFLQAIQLKFKHHNNPYLVKKTLQSIEAIHLTQSGKLLSLLINKFLRTHHKSVARTCDTIACQRVEMLLAEGIDLSESQLPIEELNKLQELMKKTRLSQRHARLTSLMAKLKSRLLNESTQQVTTQQVDLPTLSNTIPNKEWFLSLVCEYTSSTVSSASSVPSTFSAPSAHVIAHLLANLQQQDILEIMMAEDFDVSILPACISLGLARTQNQITERILTQKTTPHDSNGNVNIEPHCILQAAQATLSIQIHNLVDLLPCPHQKITWQPQSGAETDYQAKMEFVYRDSSWLGRLCNLSAALVQSLASFKELNLQVPQEATKDICRFVVTSLEVVCYRVLICNSLPPSQLIQCALESLALTLQTVTLFAEFSLDDNFSFVHSSVECVYRIFNLAKEKQLDIAEVMIPEVTEDFKTTISMCNMIAYLVGELQVNVDGDGFCSIPQFLREPLKNVVIGLARCPLVISFAQTPPLVWRMGWNPDQLQKGITKLPALPAEFLHEKDVLREFIFRVNSIGWTTRQEFEETWAGLLGVLSRPDMVEDIATEEEIERNQGACLAVKNITALLTNSLRRPQPGNPANSTHRHIPRNAELKLFSTSRGKKLLILRNIIEQEVKMMMTIDGGLKDGLSGERSNDPSDLYNENPEREETRGVFGLGQISVYGFWALNDLQPKFLDDEGHSESGQPANRTSGSPMKLPGNLDVHSCLMFLLELFGQWLSPNANPRTPLMLLCETVKSVLAISDVFTERAQFEWMFDTLLELNKNHPVEDELVTQYVISGICKAAAILGMEKDISEKVCKLIEVTLKSAHLPSRIGALYGVLYLLESEAIEDIDIFVPVVEEYLTKHLCTLSVNPTTIISDHHTLVMLATAFYIIQYFNEDLGSSEFIKKVIQTCVSLASMNEDTISPAVYQCIMKGLERLLISQIPSSHIADILVKLSMERLCVPSPHYAIPALGLLLTCLYTGEDHQQTDASTGQLGLQDPERLLVAMERVTVLFDRIRKGYPCEARIIAKVIPAFLHDFFPPQDVMNKVIGEFLSNQQPHPQIIAMVVFKVFENLHRRDQAQLVQDWVLLSLSNFTQRTPIAMAVWSLTCFLISASINQWIRAFMPYVVSRMGKLELRDRENFCIVAKDFLQNQIHDESSRRAFVSTFQPVAHKNTPYADLLACIRKDSFNTG
ncbi:huntingtin-like isoform X2 [Antedon mediterranea]|uniref:huntingtin-like isoform X2 n=1 Tax=Antedon mediterranea TaxID=105859 RepID=UPI003AF86C6F